MDLVTRNLSRPSTIPRSTFCVHPEAMALCLRFFFFFLLQGQGRRAFPAFSHAHLRSALPARHRCASSIVLPAKRETTALSPSLWQVCCAAAETMTAPRVPRKSERIVERGFSRTSRLSRRPADSCGFCLGRTPVVIRRALLPSADGGSHLFDISRRHRHHRGNYCLFLFSFFQCRFVLAWRCAWLGLFCHRGDRRRPFVRFTRR